jgi:Protein of unknown function (DUF3309)
VPTRIDAGMGIARSTHMLSTLLLILIVVALLGAVPAWPYSRDWGYGPSGVLGTVLIILLVLVLLGRV